MQCTNRTGLILLSAVCLIMLVSAQEPNDPVPTMPGGFPNLPSFPPDISDLYPDIVINEFSVDIDSGQFIELYDGGVGGMTLDGLVLVTYRRRGEASYGRPISLDGHVTDENGYFLIGQASQHPQIELSRELRSSQPPNAIALYFDDPTNLASRTPVTGTNLVEAVVYSDTSDAVESALVTVLSSGHLPLVQPTNQANVSLSRCRSWERLRLEAFTSSTQTPGGDNMCILPDLYINEINVATEDQQINQFVEIFDGGVGQQRLDGTVLVLYKERDSLSYLALDLTGYSTDIRGFCVVGWVNNTNADVGLEFDPTVGFIKSGSNAVALHLSSPQRFRKGRAASAYNLIDAIVYGHDPALELLHTLLPHQQVLNEVGGSTSSGDRSISRCSCCHRLNSESFGVGPATPGAINVDCQQNNVTHIETLDHYTNLIRLNEIRIAQRGLPRGDFVELYDGGFLGTGLPLDNLVLVLYNSEGESSYKAVDLHGYRTDTNGFFVIGPSSIQPSGLLMDESHWFNGNVGAVAVYKGSPEDFPVGTPATSTNLLDAVVYGDSNLLLLDRLTPGQNEVQYSVGTGESSILRCYTREAFNVFAYSMGPPSPGLTNVCPPPPLFINEVNILDIFENVGQYVELSSDGVAGFPLNDLVMFFWKWKLDKEPKLYRSYVINGRRTDKNGLFLIGYRGLTSPRPDMTPFSVPIGEIKNYGCAISLHRGLRSENFQKNSPLTAEGLVDVLIHGTDNEEDNQRLIEFFGPYLPHDQPQVNELRDWSQRDESINRCVDSENNTVYQMAHISPKGPNHCPSRRDAVLIINEVNLVSSEQFLELWDLGTGFMSLDDFVVVLYGEGDMSYWTIPLTGFTTDSMGYFIMGVVNVQPMAQFQFADGFMRHMYGAVALYRLSASSTFPESGPPSSQGLVDAVVYSDQDSNPVGLTNVLTPNTASAVDSRSLQLSGFSLSRCLSPTLRSKNPYDVRPQTPRGFNDCPAFSNDVVINEVNVEHPGQAAQEEFIELYDGGVGNVKMRYLSLVLFNSHNGDRSYMTVDLHGKRTDANGYFVIGAQDVEGVNLKLKPRVTGGFLQEGPNAIALYRAPSGAFPHYTEPIARSLVDAVVYSTEDSTHIPLVDKLMPGQSIVVEDSNHTTGDETINRCHGSHRLNSEVFTMGLPSPGRPNNCSSSSGGPASDILINEVNVEVTGEAGRGGEFIELTDKGVGMSLLDGLLLVLFNGANQDRSYWEIDLSGYSTNPYGFFVIGTSGVTPSPDIVVPDNFLQNGPDAAVLYKAMAWLFPRGTIATSLNMVDAIVYNTDTSAAASAVADDSLLDKLAPGQRSVIEYAVYSDRDMSLSRCLSNSSRMLASFTVSQPTPGQPNICSSTPVVINEIKLDGHSVGFIELYDGGRGSTSLDSYSVKLYDSLARVYSTQSLRGKSTNGNGYFVYGKPSGEWTVDLTVSGSDFLHTDGSGAMALYKEDDDQGTQPVLTDAVVYDYVDQPGSAAVELLTPGQPLVRVDPDFVWGDRSITRCVCCVPLASSAFTVTAPTPGQENRCVESTRPTMPTNVIISEVGLVGRGSGEYVELRGPPGASLDTFMLVLAESTKQGPVYYFSLSLDRRVIPSDGIFIIGAVDLSPPADALLPQSPVIRPGEGAVSIYRNSESWFVEGTTVTSTDLVDAVVFTNVSSVSLSELSSILGFDSIFTGNFSTVADISTPSISRCACCNTQDPSAFTLSTRTPGEPNQCPRGTFKRTIQMHILDASYQVWVTNPRYTGDLRRQIVSGINTECKCGFNENYLKGEKLLNGSVYYQVDMLALSQAHSKLLYDSYVRFVSKKEKLTIFGADFNINSKCFSDCLSGGKPSTPGKREGGGSSAIPVAVTVVVIVIAAIVAVTIYVILRRRKGVLFITKTKGESESATEGEFKVTSNRTLSDLDVLGTTTENRNATDFFANPVYLYQASREPVPQPGPPTKAEPKGKADGKTETKESGYADADKLNCEGRGYNVVESMACRQPPYDPISDHGAQPEID